MTFPIVISVVILGSLVMNYAEFVRLTGVWGKNKVRRDNGFLALILISSVAAGCVTFSSISSIRADHAWRYFVVGFIALVFVMLVAEGIVTYWSLRRE
jgi:hypothetical protein